MSRLPSVLVLSFAVVFGQSSAFTQKKERSKTEKKEATQKSADPVVGKTKDGKPVYEGARGGFYYLTRSGNKSYVNDFVGAKIVGKTAKGLEPEPEKQEPATKSEADEAVGKTQDGKTVYEGSKGGHYYLNDKGDKTYVRDFVGSKIVGKTPDGKAIYEGPRGGWFYYNDNGNKVYLKKK